MTQQILIKLLLLDLVLVLEQVWTREVLVFELDETKDGFLVALVLTGDITARLHGNLCL